MTWLKDEQDRARKGQLDALSEKTDGKLRFTRVADLWNPGEVLAALHDAMRNVSGDPAASILLGRFSVVASASIRTEYVCVRVKPEHPYRDLTSAISRRTRSSFGAFESFRGGWANIGLP